MTLAQQAFHTISKLRFSNFTRIGRAHRRNMVGIVQTGLQKGELSVELQPMHIKE
ncbi:Uncharacterised protein [Salmonella enterica subsp. enterica serovar Bovismorbificans]|uniref:Uncharacterized protein n=1 Tax=Salmonella enterica subsp. enterica serovar Bovismorbificans TaxID=58097 RepID=A0A655BWS6_SALET|nr:Uncharacterised protein [Salmonella enterica subsp. enterica serovar Bovismorbificans]